MVTRERPTFAAFAKALEWAEAAGPPAATDSLTLATAGSGGSSTSLASRGAAGACAGGWISGGIKLSREPASAGKMGYGILAFGSVSVHGHPTNHKRKHGKSKCSYSIY